MDIRVRSGTRVAAVLAGAARERLRAGTEQALAEPQGEPLFSDAGRAVKQQRSRECVTTNRAVEPRAKGIVAVNGKERHPYKVRAARPSEQCQGRHAS